MLDTQANVPASVAVVFPRADSSILGTDVYEVSVTLASLALTEYDGEFGRPDVSQIIHSTAVANYSGGGSPVNAAELLALAQQIATDFYLWRLALVEVRYRSIVPWTADGMHDVEWTHGGGMTTAVHRSEWDPEFGQLKHAGTYGSSDVPAATGITHINNDATALQQIAVGDAGSDLNIATTAAAYDNAKTYSAGWVVLSSGSTYRFINATPSAGHSPPNATYWEDVTGQGLNVVNVPHRCPDIDEIGGMIEITGKNTTATWTSPDCPITATIEAIGQGADANGPGGLFGYVNAAGGGGAYARVNSYSIPANTTYNITFDYALSYGARFSTGAGVTVVNAAPGNGASGGLGSSSTGDVTYNGGDGYVDGSTLNGGGGGSGYLYANGIAGTITAKGTGTGNGGDPGIEKTHTYSSTFVIPAVSSSVTVTVVDTSSIVIADTVYILGLNGSSQKVYLTGTAVIIDATTFTFTLISITHGSVGDTVVAFAKILQTNPALSDAQSPGGGAGGIPFPSFAGANSEIPYVPSGGNGLIRISWGPGVRLLNGKTGAVTLKPESGTGLDITNDSSNNGLQLSGPLVSGKLPVSTGGTGRTTLDSGQLIAGAGTSAVDSLSSTRVSGETIELKLGSDSWIAFSEGSF